MKGPNHEYNPPIIAMKEVRKTKNKTEQHCIAKHTPFILAMNQTLR